jgi:hypothetical protein
MTKRYPVSYFFQKQNSTESKQKMKAKAAKEAAGPVHEQILEAIKQRRAAKKKR